MKLTLVQCQTRPYILYTYKVKIIYSRLYIIERRTYKNKKQTTKKVPSAKNTHARTSMKNIIVLYILYTIPIPTCIKTKT